MRQPYRDDEEADLLRPVGTMGRLSYLGLSLLASTPLIAFHLVMAPVFEEDIRSPLRTGAGLLLLAAYAWFNHCYTTQRLRDLALSPWHSLWITGLFIADAVALSAMDGPMLFANHVGTGLGMILICAYLVLITVPSRRRRKERQEGKKESADAALRRPSDAELIEKLKNIPARGSDDS